MSVNAITTHSNHSLVEMRSEVSTSDYDSIEMQSELSARKRKQFDSQDYCEYSSKRIATDGEEINIPEEIDMLKECIQNQDKKFKMLHEQFKLMQNTFKQQDVVNREQSSEIASLKSELSELRSTKVAEEPSSSNPFMDLSKDELFKKLDINEKKSRFFREKGAAGGYLFYELNRILEYVAVNAISTLAPGIISSDSVSDILKSYPGAHLERLSTAKLFGQCHLRYCLKFIKKGGSSSDLFLRFLYNTIKHRKEFKSLKYDLDSGEVSEQIISERLISIICKYGLNKLRITIIHPNDFNNPDVSSEYRSDNSTSQRRLNANGVCDRSYLESFGLWPFNEFVSVAVDPEGFPGHYLTSLFINHFSGSPDPVRRVKIDSEESVELEIKQLREALELKKSSSAKSTN